MQKRKYIYFMSSYWSCDTTRYDSIVDAMNKDLPFTMEGCKELKTKPNTTDIFVYRNINRAS